MLQVGVLSVRFWPLQSQLSLKIWRSKPFCRTSFTGNKAFCSSSSDYKNKPQHTVPNTQYPCPSKSQQNDKCDNFTLLYKLHGIQFCRTLSRLKILQTSLTVIFLPPIYYYYMKGQVTYLCVQYSTGTAVFACIMLYCLSYFLRRIIGMIYLNDAGTTVKVSHLTFWGKRKDLFIPITDIQSLEETGDDKNEILLQFKRYSNPDVLYFTTRFGYILDRKKFSMLFGAFK
ncbi:transmembrane protein 186 isoform X2 [Pelobates fuscus]